MTLTDSSRRPIAAPPNMHKGNILIGRRHLHGIEQVAAGSGRRLRYAFHSVIFNLSTGPSHIIQFACRPCPLFRIPTSPITDLFMFRQIVQDPWSGGLILACAVDLHSLESPAHTPNEQVPRGGLDMVVNQTVQARSSFRQNPECNHIRMREVGERNRGLITD